MRRPPFRPRAWAARVYGVWGLGFIGFFGLGLIRFIGLIGFIRFIGFIGFNYRAYRAYRVWGLGFGFRTVALLFLTAAAGFDSRWRWSSWS